MRRYLRSDLRPGRRSGSLIAAAGLGALLVSGPSRPVAGADPYVAGSDLTRVVDVDGPRAAAATDRAASHERLLGLAAPARRTIRLVTDRREARSYVEVTDLDARDRPLAVLRYEATGRLIAAVRLGWTPGRGRPLVSPEAAAAAGTRFVRSVGVQPAGPAGATRRSAGGWSMAWPRVVNGVPVPGDGLRVQLWADGSFHSLASSDRRLAEPPDTTRPRSEAEATVGRLLDRWIPAASRSQVRIVDAALAWVAPNDTYEAARPDAPGDVLRLAWVVRVRSSGSLAQSLRGLEVAIDAGDGTLLGGDVLR